jgi:hypothetical protein
LLGCEVDARRSRYRMVAAPAPLIHSVSVPPQPHARVLYPARPEPPGGSLSFCSCWFMAPSPSTEPTFCPSV